MGRKKKAVSSTPSLGSPSVTGEKAIASVSTVPLVKTPLLEQQVTTSQNRLSAMDQQGELVSSSLVHPSAGLIPLELHNTILAYDQVLGFSGSAGNQIEALFSNLGENDVQSQIGNRGGSGTGDLEMQRRMRALASQLRENLEQNQPICAPTQPAPVAQRRLEMDGTQAPTTWSSLFQRSPLAGKGVSLKFVAPLVKEGKKLAQLQKNEVDDMTRKWLAAIVLYVVGDTPTIAAIKRFISANWVNIGTPNVFLHDDGYFIIQFDSVDDRNSVMSGGTYTFFSKPMIIKSWSPEFNFYEEVLRVIPLWVRLPNLPLNCWSGDSLSRIASLLGVPICADDCTTRQQRVSFARVLVEMDVTAILPDHIWIEDVNGQEFKQQVQYDWKPSYCHKCQLPGHNCASVAKTQVQQASKPPQVKKMWVPKKTTVPPAVIVTPSATPLNQSLVVNQSGADAGWKVATKGARSRGVPVSHNNSFRPLNEDDSYEVVVEDDVEELLDGDSGPISEC
ncbi:uncharacterized protein [Spinacia oleracea]|uniref:DUF4283 domain-containing protein n=1 Tax=Spinacia oleracea TaxID=3562 RepID=A0ABM3RBV1_SPIOL|nr:uncharacterized protein LOC130467953 [Spinacia oleracea]XP_056693090.1 uncharacterized protein LOC130467953 [Spinacia oleracea]XP_056693091.1 uncharacterized protein LOC130467953 [Spinacia oleracea]